MRYFFSWTHLWPLTTVELVLQTETAAVWSCDLRSHRALHSKGPHTSFNSPPSLFQKRTAFWFCAGSHKLWANLVFMFTVNSLFLTVFYLANFQILFKMQLKYHLASENYPDFLPPPVEGKNSSFLYVSWFRAIWHQLLLQQLFFNEYLYIHFSYMSCA